MFKAQFILALILGALLVTPVCAEVLLIEAIGQEPPNTSEGLPRPTNGMTMAQVREQFGEPVKEHPWIGDPPITRWDYARYSVFFEYDKVLNTVVHR
jgi:hypothetical protein